MKYKYTISVLNERIAHFAYCLNSTQNYLDRFKNETKNEFYIDYIRNTQDGLKELDEVINILRKIKDEKDPG